MGELFQDIFNLLDVTNGYFWIVLGLVLVIFEALGAALAMASLGLAAILTGFVAFLGDFSFPTLLTVLGVLSLVLFAASRPLAAKLHGKSTPTNVDALVGETAVVTRPIHGATAPGYVKILGEEWQSLGAEGGTFESGDCVRIEHVKGNTLYVSGPNQSNCKEEA